MCEDLPLPPNWESRFDPGTQRWFFVDHVNKKTSWDDPRPAYYAARRKRSSLSNDHSAMEASSPTLDTPYASVGSDSGRGTRYSPPPDENEEREEQFMEYLHALRAAYPEYKDRQLAKLMEKWLGDSSGLRKFLATHLKRKVSSSSETTTKRASVTSSEKTPGGGSLKRSDSPCTPTPAVGYEEIGDRRLPTSPLAGPHRMSSSSVARRESRSPEPRLPSSSTAKSPVSAGTMSPVSSASTPPAATHDSKSSVQSTLEKDHIQATKETSLNHESNGTEPVQSCFPSSSSSVMRYIAHGPDPQLLGPRVQARGPDPQLAHGPDQSLARGPDPTLLRPRPISASGMALIGSGRNSALVAS